MRSLPPKTSRADPLCGTPPGGQSLDQSARDAIAATRDIFPIAHTHVFLNHAGVSPTSMPVVDAVHAFMLSMANIGRPSFEDWERLADECRGRFAQLVGADPEEIAFVRNTSHGLSLLSAGLDWAPGDRVAIASAVEYPSNVYPWLDLERRGVVALDHMEAPEGAVSLDEVDRVLGPQTRVLAVSSAQYATGGVTDLEAIGVLCSERDVLFCVDGIQTVGALPTDVRACRAQVLSADSHKWMLGMMGIGCVYVDRAVLPRIHPPLIGWRSTTDAWNFGREGTAGPSTGELPGHTEAGSKAEGDHPGSGGWRAKDGLSAVRGAPVPPGGPRKKGPG